jgi:hypothetical protein
MIHMMERDTLDLYRTRSAELIAAAERERAAAPLRRRYRRPWPRLRKRTAAAERRATQRRLAQSGG